MQMEQFTKTQDLNHKPLQNLALEPSDYRDSLTLFMNKIVGC